MHLDIRQNMFNGIIEEILIPEFINKRPFREVDHLRREGIFQGILKSVNSKVSCRMGTRNLIIKILRACLRGIILIFQNLKKNI